MGKKVWINGKLNDVEVLARDLRLRLTGKVEEIQAKMRADILQANFFPDESEDIPLDFFMPDAENDT